MSKGSAAMTGPRLTNKQVEDTRAHEDFASILSELTPSDASSGAAKGKGAKSSSSGASPGATKGKTKGKSKSVQSKAMPKPSASTWRTARAKANATAAAVAVTMPTIAESFTIRFDVPLYDLQDLSSWEISGYLFLWIATALLICDSFIGWHIYRHWTQKLHLNDTRGHVRESEQKKK